MGARAEPGLPVVERIKQSLVGLRMPRALESVDAVVRQLERGEVCALEALDALLAEELTLRESRRELCGNLGDAVIRRRSVLACW